jgi:hypothetical protein
MMKEKITYLLQHNKFGTSGIKLLLTGGYSEDLYSPASPNFMILNLELKGGRGDKGTGRLGDWEIGRLGDWEIGRLGEGEIGRLGDWEIGRLGDWEIGRGGEIDFA